MTSPAPYEKSKFLGSGGSMVARLKLKGIDGRAPPGVKQSSSASGGEISCYTLSNCGKVLKLHLPSRRSKDRGGRVNDLGYGNNGGDETMGNPQPSPKCSPEHTDAVHRLNGSGRAFSDTRSA